jgi:hypothetical protein
MAMTKKDNGRNVFHMRITRDLLRVGCDAATMP